MHIEIDSSFFLGIVIGVIIVVLIGGEAGIVTTFQGLLFLGSLLFMKKVIDEFFNWTLRRDKDL